MIDLGLDDEAEVGDGDLLHTGEQARDDTCLLPTSHLTLL